MTVPGIVQSALDGEEIVTRVSLGGDDELFVTPSSSILYRAEGLLSDESIDEYPHDADRIALSEGRRKTSFTLEYSLDDPAEFTIPASKTEAVLRPVLAGVLSANGITDPDETVAKIYRFSELTLVLASDRLVKHIGEAVWDEDYEEYHFDDVTNLSFEDGSVATQIVLEVGGRPQRIKAPNDAADDIRERLQRALFAYHGVDSLAELNTAVGEEPWDEGDDATVDFGDGVDPLDADPPEVDDRSEGGTTTAEAANRSESAAQAADEPAGAESRSNRSGDGAATLESQPLMDDLEDESAAGGTQHAEGAGAAAGAGSAPNPEVLDRLETLEAAVEQQNERLEKQQQTIEQLIAELRQGR